MSASSRLPKALFMSVSFARDILTYDPEEGKIFWAKRIGNRLPGSRAGTNSAGGYRIVRIFRHRYLEHRIIWLIVHGRWPENEIDHINGDRRDNRLCNLREATRAQNACNRRLSARNKSGHRGVSWNRASEKWSAKIWHNNTRISLGHFSSLEDATRAYRAKAAELHAEFGRAE